MKYCIILALINLFLCSDVIDIQINEEINFNTSQKQFCFEYLKEIEQTSIFILFYETIGNINAIITFPNLEETTYPMYDDDRYIYFPFTKDGNYCISLSPKSERDDTFEGKFKIISSEKPFTLDITTKEIYFDYLLVDTRSEPCPLIFSLENKLNKNFMKRVKTGEFKIYIKESEDNYKEVTGKLIYFKKDSNYVVKIEFIEDNNDDLDFYYIHDFLMEDIDLNLTKIENFSPGEKFNRNIKYLFTRVNFNTHIWGDGLNLYYAYINESINQYNNFPNDIQSLKFLPLEVNEYNKIEKPENVDYMILFIEFDPYDMSLFLLLKDIPVELNEEKHLMV